MTLTLPGKVIAASGFDCMSHALESITARAWPRRLNPARGVNRPVSQGANPFSDALAGEALRAVGKFLVRAVNDASDVEARTEMMFAATQAGIAFNAAGCHLPHGLSYPVSGLTRVFHLDGYPAAKSLVPHGMAVVLNNPRCGATPRRALPSATCTAQHAWAPRRATRGRKTRAEALAGRVIDMMRATGMPNGLADLASPSPMSTRWPPDPSRSTG